MTDRVPTAYFLPAGSGADGGEVFTPTDSTRSLWSTDMQHGAPPSALLVRALDRLDDSGATRLTRVVTELLGPIPVAPVTVRARTVRPGRNIELIEAELLAEGPGGEPMPVATATAWRMSMADTAAVAVATDPPLPAADPTGPRFVDRWAMDEHTYLDSVEWKSVRAADADGPGMMWARPLIPLVAGEKTSALESAFCVIDAANGVGATVDPARYTFLNTDLTVHLHREPTGQWTGLAAQTSIGSDGIGLCSAVVHDELGPTARSAQTLLVRPTGR